jgi:hypothetical protein
MKLSELKKSLSQCHLTSNDPKLKLLLDVKDPEYFLNRIMECIHECKDGNDILENTKLGIQLFNLYRVSYQQHLEDIGNESVHS